MARYLRVRWCLWSMQSRSKTDCNHVKKALTVTLNAFIFEKMPSCEQVAFSCILLDPYLSCRAWPWRMSQPKLRYATFPWTSVLSLPTHHPRRSHSLDRTLQVPLRLHVPTHSCYQGPPAPEFIYSRLTSGRLATCPVIDDRMFYPLCFIYRYWAII